MLQLLQNSKSTHRIIQMQNSDFEIMPSVYKPNKTNKMFEHQINVDLKSPDLFIVKNSSN